MLGVIAYLDPGTGSMVAAAIAGAGASVAVAVKAGWHKTLGRKKSKTTDPAITPDSFSKQTTIGDAVGTDPVTDADE